MWGMKNTLKDLYDYARSKGLSIPTTERIIDEAITDEKGFVINYDDICFGIDCESEYLGNWIIVKIMQ